MQIAQGLIEAAGTQVTLRVMPDNKTCRMVPEADVEGALALLRERRAANAHLIAGHVAAKERRGATLGGVESPQTPPTKIEVPPVAESLKSPVGFVAPKSLEQEFTDTVRKLIHLCIRLNDDREVTINADGAELVKQVRIEKKETISG